MNCPKVSVITVTYNAATQLRATLANLAKADYPNLEVVVIDGASGDDTLEVIGDFSGLISYWSSEPDKGIYDAMNKGIRASTGDYLWFINAGDFIYDPGILSEIFPQGAPSADIYYGETLIVSASGERMGLRRKKLPDRLTWRSFRHGMVVSHQSIIVSRKVAPMYNLSYRYASDVEWVLLSLKNARSIVNTGRIMSEFAEGGISSRARKASLRERFRIMRKYFGLIPTLLSHIGFVFGSFGPEYRKADEELLEL